MWDVEAMAGWCLGILHHRCPGDRDARTAQPLFSDSPLQLGPEGNYFCPLLYNLMCKLLTAMHPATAIFLSIPFLPPFHAKLIGWWSSLEGGAPL